MASFYYDVSKLKREWTENSLIEWGNYMAECFRSDALYKDGWEISELTEFDKHECTIEIKWGLDEEGYKQEWNDTISYTKEDWFIEYDKHVAIKQLKTGSK